MESALSSYNAAMRKGGFTELDATLMSGLPKGPPSGWSVKQIKELTRRLHERMKSKSTPPTSPRKNVPPSMPRKSPRQRTKSDMGALRREMQINAEAVKIWVRMILNSAKVFRCRRQNQEHRGWCLVMVVVVSQAWKPSVRNVIPRKIRQLGH